MGERRGLNDHPLRAACNTCRFAGTDGDFGEVATCDAGDEDTDDINDWAAGGYAGPCPAWRPGGYVDQRSLDDPEDRIAETAQLRAAVTR